MSHGRVPAPNAFWANATIGRSHEIGDCDEVTADHPSVSTVSTALAIAEMLGRMSGRDIITAIVLGTDLALRIC